MRSAATRRLAARCTSELRCLPPGVRAYLAAVVVLWAAAAVWLVLTSSPDARDFVLAGLLLAAGALSVETTRWVGQPAGTMVRDLLSVWWLPMAVLLPPVFVLMAPVPLLAMTQWRVSRSLLHRRVFSAASIGLAYATASVVFHAVLSGSAEPPPGPGLLSWALLAGAVGLLGAALNDLLVAVAVLGADPQTRWRTLLLQRENLLMEGVEACVGVTVAVLMGLEPALIAFTLPPVLLLQRGLLHAHLRAVALLDGKTGLLNAPSWEREAAGKLLALKRRRQPAAVLLIDVDHFKRVNDEHGHLAGDQVLRAVAETLLSAVRDGDLVGRFGGEEFVALLPGADTAESVRVAERLRHHVDRLVVPLGTGETVSVTVSIGVATAPPGDLLVPELLAAADYCMYQAKAAGRNHVVLSR